MKYVTQATEKRVNQMVKNGNRYGNELLYLLNELKSRIGCYGASIKEIEGWNLHIDNADQIKVVVSNLLRGIGISFEKYITVVDLYDLHYVTIKDFNELVKACYEYEA